MRKRLTPESLLEITLVSDPSFSPDASKVLFTVTRMDGDRDRYLSTLWLMDYGNRHYESITSGPSDFCGRWSPSGERIGFLSRRGFKEDERGVSLWITDLRGEPRELYRSRNGIVSWSWIDDGRILLLERTGEVEEDVKRIERLPVWFNGAGFVYSLYNRAYILDAYGGVKREVTPEEVHVVDAAVSRDGRLLAYISRDEELKPYVTSLHILDMETGEEATLLGGYTLWGVAWSGSGLLAVLGHERARGFATHNRIYVVDPGEPDVIAIVRPGIYNVSNTVNSDVRGPSCSRRVVWDGEDLYFQVSRRGRVVLYRSSPPGWDAKPFLELGDMSIDEFDIRDGRLVFTAMSFDRPKEIYTYEEGEPRRATGFTDGFREKYFLAAPLHFRFTASDGAKIDGWVLKPRGKGPFPWVLYIHGGPKTMFGPSFMEEFQLYVSNGYAVVFTNPRGSDGYDEEFADIRGRYGERDYQDLMEAIDHVLEKFDFLDRERIGVAGGSYGGFMTNWIVTQTDRFRAAVTMRSISDWISMFGTTDIGFYFVEDQIGCSPLEEISRCIEKSPVAHAYKAKTPTLIIHSMNDYRCWMDQALIFFTALKKVGVPTRLVLFPKEDHDLSRKGKPKHRVERLKEILSWLDRWLKDGSGEE